MTCKEIPPTYLFFSMTATNLFVCMEKPQLSIKQQASVADAGLWRGLKLQLLHIYGHCK
jgi:hypothetical protein